MLTRIEALNYRSLRHVSQRVSPFQTLVGPNGSGKSNFLDVVGFLGDMLRVGLLPAIRGEGESVPQRAADPMHLCWMRQGGWFELAVEMEIPKDRRQRLGNGTARKGRYETRVRVLGGENDDHVELATETFWLIPAEDMAPGKSEHANFPYPVRAPRSIVQAPGTRPPGWQKVLGKNAASGADYFLSEATTWNSSFRLGPSKSALANLPDDDDKFPAATWAKRVLMEGIRKVVLNAQKMRLPSPPGSPHQFLPDGSNLPRVVHRLQEKIPTLFARWIDHLRTAIPDLKTVSTIERPEDRHRYIVVEYQNGLKAPSWVVSDGTLRLLALTLLAYAPDPELGGAYLIEEPENGIHPKAVETVYQSLSSVYGAQVLCASHSPVVLGLAAPADLLCFAKDESGATAIVRGDEHPQLKNWQGALDLGTLFAAGVLG